MPSLVQRLTRFVLVGAGAVLACSTITFAVIQRDRLVAGLWVNHTFEVLIQVEKAKNDLYEILLIQKDGRCSIAAYKQFLADLNELKQTVADNPSQVRRLAIDTSNLSTPDRIRQIQRILQEAAEEERVLLVRRLKWQDEANTLLSGASVILAFSLLGTLTAVVVLKQHELEQERQQTRAITSLVHDIRNPIARLSIDVQLLEREAKLPAVTNRVRKVLICCDFIVELLEDVRFMSQVLVPAPALTNIKTFGQQLTDKVNTIYATPGGDRVTFTFATSSDTESFPLDAALIQRVLFNLLSNAIAYSPDDSLVAFTATVYEDSVVFTVADRGIGIPQGDRAKLFEPFKRGSNVGGKQGTGLGLTIAHQVVKACGGKIWFESRLPESGTIFFVQLKK